jgi:hypothetical protein
VKPQHILGETCVGQAAFFNKFVPDYIGRSYRPMVVKIQPWSSTYGHELSRIHEARAQKRIDSYLDPGEVSRVQDKLTRKDNASIRFGTIKTGHGYLGERGDFCLIGGAIRDSHLTVFYRRLELLGGFAFDQCVIDMLADLLGLRWKSVSIMAVQADVFASVRGSGEKERLYHVLREIFA